MCVLLLFCFVIIGLKIVSRRQGRYLKTFPQLVAPSWLNMSPWRAMATPKVPKMMWTMCVFMWNMYVFSEFGNAMAMPWQCHHGIAIAMPWRCQWCRWCHHGQAKAWPKVSDVGEISRATPGTRRNLTRLSQEERGLPGCSQEAGRSPMSESVMWEKFPTSLPEWGDISHVTLRRQRGLPSGQKKKKNFKTYLVKTRWNNENARLGERRSGLI